MVILVGLFASSPHQFVAVVSSLRSVVVKSMAATLCFLFSLLANHVRCSSEHRSLREREKNVWTRGEYM